jgi:RHS repeat-associated protein
MGGPTTIGYAPDGNILYSNDGANGNWAYTYDDLNQLTKGVCSANCPATTGVQYTYDRYGNRWQESVTGSGIQPSYTFNAYNHITGSGIVYDAAGNVTNDGLGNAYTYDAENRITAVSGANSASYVYDAEGHRVRATVNSQTRDFLYDLSGRTIDEFVPGGTYWLGTWLRGEAYAGGLHIATYANSTTEFDNSEWLGTFRVRSDVSGNLLEKCTSMPFGEDLTCTGAEVTPIHFTGKERDTESGLDNFGARYFGSTMGRFMSPDWSAKAEPVPYAKLADPQSLNLYAYVGNNPLSRIDADGHYEVNASNCGDNAKCQKKYDKAANKFEARRAKDLNSKKESVRTAAANYGARGEANGVHVGFGDLSAQHIDGSVDPSGSTPGNPNIQVQIDFTRAGSAETQTHEGTHIGDDMKFLNSYDPRTGSYDQTLNPTHFQTEFNAFKAGADVNHEHGFGPNDVQGITKYIRDNYNPRILNLPVFNPANFPAGVPDDEPQ